MKASPRTTRHRKESAPDPVAGSEADFGLFFTKLCYVVFSPKRISNRIENAAKGTLERKDSFSLCKTNFSARIP